MNTAVSTTGKSSAAEELFREALKMYNDRPDLDPTKHCAEFAQCASADDIMRILKKRMTGLMNFRDDHWAEVRKKLKPVVEVILRVTNIVGESAQSIGIPGEKGVFAAVGLLLAATQAQSARYDTLEKLLEQLGIFLSRFTVLYGDTSSQRRPALEQIASRVLAHLFYVLALSTEFLGKSRIRHYSSALIGFPDNLKDALQKLEKLTKEEGMMTGAHTLVAAERNLAATEKLLPQIQKIQHVQVEDNIKKWLLATDPATDRNNALTKRQAGTGDWFLQTEAFKKWRSSGGNPVLWLHGQSGSGKTILSACIVHELLRSIPDLAYFFFVIKAKESLDGMLSAILIQLATAPERHRILSEAYSSDHHKGPPPRVSLLAYFEKMLAVPLDITLVVDALDEHPVSRSQLLEFLTKLSRDHRDHVRLLVTSRDESDIHAAMKDICVTEVDLSKEVQAKEDIYKYVTSVLQSDEPFRTWSNSTLALIKHRLLQESMFRLVALQLDRLRHSTPIDVEATLTTLPGSLMEMYGQILQQMESRNPITAERAMQVFKIISCASRPLTVDEVAEVFSVQFDTDRVQVFKEHRPKNPEPELMRTCTSAFIRIQSGRRGDTVHFAHASVLEYLQRSHEIPPYFPSRIDSASAAMTLAKLCLCTIVSMIRPSIPQRSAGPFDDYALEFWLKETARAVLLNPVDKIRWLLDSILLGGMESIPARQPWLAYGVETSSCTSPLLCASFLGLQDYVQRILVEHSTYVNKADAHGQTPLHVASQHGHLEVARVLIEHGASVDQAHEDGWTSLHVVSKQDVARVLIEHRASIDRADNYGWTPLFSASQHGRLDVAQILIEHGVSINPVDKNGRTPLHVASEKNVTQLLIEHGASIDKADEHGQTPLHVASQHGHLEVARVLIEHGASINQAAMNGWTPLYFASVEGHLDVAGVLIEHGASIDQADTYGWTPLNVASRYGHLDVVQVLIEHGTSINQAAKNGQTPLYFASRNGHLDVTRVLIEHGASIDQADKDGWTALYVASWAGHFEVTQILIGRGASIDRLADKDGRTALYVASWAGHLDIVRVLIEHGSSIDQFEKDGQTPLYIASRYGHLDIVRVLIEYGASVDHADKNRRTPLYIASQYGHLAVVRLLIECGASVNQANKDGQPPLHIASQRGHLDVMRVLTEVGASIDRPAGDQ